MPKVMKQEFNKMTFGIVTSDADTLEWSAELD
ncbi:hypothetical protein Sbal223_3068 [Shewanella baltica OS223]|nr:hypothetical protein Sbal223_3068 [Shewanella baltica OS223]